MRKILYIVLALIFISCGKDYNIKTNKNDVLEWQKKDFEKLKQCCDDFEKSSIRIVLSRTFKKDLRNRVLNELEFKRKTNNIEFFELYSNDNKNLIDVFVNGDLNSFSFAIFNDSISKINKQDDGVLWFINKKEAIKEIKKSKECCNLELSDPHLFIYTKLKLDKDKLEIQESYMK